MAPEQLYTIEELAAACRVAPVTVRLWLRKGAIPGGRRVGRRRLWTAAEVRRAQGEGKKNEPNSLTSDN